MLWRDTRAEKLLPALKAACPGDHPELANISAFHPLARLWWLKHEEEATFIATAKMLEPKDFLHLKLTGTVAGDHVSYARLAAAAAATETGPSLFAAAGLPTSLIPTLQPPVSIVGRGKPGLPGALAQLAGAAVVAMANDTWASVVGLGAMTPGLAYNLSGTTEVLGLVSNIGAVSAGLLTVDWSAGMHQLGGPSQSGGDCVMWLVELIGGHRVSPTEAGAMMDHWLAGAREPEPVLFLPYLQGERVPYWDPHLRGAFVGLNRRHGQTDLAWAVLEGIAFLNRVVLEQAEAATGVTTS
jgi:xylulokinase